MHRRLTFLSALRDKRPRIILVDVLAKKKLGKGTLGRKILVVDEEAVLVETIAYNLEQAGYQVITASDGASALEAARREKPDVVILDIMLLVMDGLEVCRQLGSEHATDASTIIMLAAKGE